MGKKNVQVPATPAEETVRIPIVIPKRTQSQKIQHLEDEIQRIWREFRIVDHDLTALYIVIGAYCFFYVLIVLLGGSDGN
jgi:hypothetical protein